MQSKPPSPANSDIIGEVLDIAPITPVPLPAIKADLNVDQDFEYARGNLIAAIEKGQEALTGILDVAGMSQHPRSYEVVATMIKTLADANKDLLELSKRRKDLQGPEGGPTTVNNNLYVGSTADLLKLLKDKNNGS